MGWDAGSIESTLDVDLSPFDRGLEEAKAKAREFADKRYTTTVDIDTKRSNDELAAVEQRLRGIESSVDRIGNKTGGGGSGRGGLFSRLGNLPNPSGLMLGLGAAIPATVPFAGLAGGIAGGALSAGVTGGLGLGAFGLAAKSNLTAITGDITKLNKLTAQYNAATTNKQRAAVLVKEQALWKSLDPAQRAAVKNVQSLESAWTSYKKKLEPQTFAVVADGAKIASTGLKYLLPTARAVGDEIDLLAKRAEHAFKAPFWHQFFGDFLPGEAARSVDALGTTLGHVGTGVAHLVQDFAPLAHLLEGGSDSLSARFEKWTEGAGPGKFVAWVEKEGPIAAKALEAIATGLLGLGKGLAPIGNIELKALTPILNFLGKLGDEHPAVITALGGALLTVGAGLKAIHLVGSIPGLGVGGRLGGGGGGILGKAAPVPVYVTNWGGSGLPGGPGGGAPEEKPGAVTKALDYGRKVLPFLKGAGPIALGAAAAYTIANTRNPPGYHPADIAAAGRTVQSDPAVGQRYAQLLAQFQQQHPGSALAGGMSVVQQQQLMQQAIRDVKDYGTASAHSANDIDMEKSSLAHLRAEFATLGPQVQRALGALQKLPGYLQAAQAAAENGGFVIGKNLVDGITIGIRQGGGKVALEMVSVVKGALHAGKVTAVLGSPSKVTIQYGKWIAEGLAIGFTSYSAQLEKAFAGGTRGALNHLGTTLNNAANQYRTDLAARAQLGSQISGSLMGGASIANANLSNTGGATVGGFLSDQIGELTPFRAALRKLRRKHLDPRLIQQITDAEVSTPGRGLMLAQQILSGESISGLNKQERTLGSLTDSIGSTVSGAAFAPTLSRDAASLAKVANAIDRLASQGLHLTPAERHALAREIGREIHRAFPSLNIRELGHAGAIRIYAS